MGVLRDVVLWVGQGLREFVANCLFLLVLKALKLHYFSFEHIDTLLFYLQCSINRDEFQVSHPCSGQRSGGDSPGPEVGHRVVH